MAPPIRNGSKRETCTARRSFHNAAPLDDDGKRCYQRRALRGCNRMQPDRRCDQAEANPAMPATSAPTNAATTKISTSTGTLSAMLGHCSEFLQLPSVACGLRQ